MSCFIVEKAHIDLLVSAATAFRSFGPMRWRDESGEPAEYNATSNPDEVGRMLWAENVRSFDYRYESRYADEHPDFNGYAYSPTASRINPVAVLKAIACYEYQSCEHPAWENSEAAHFCVALRHRMIENLPGYEEADWGVGR